MHWSTVVSYTVLMSCVVHVVGYRGGLPDSHRQRIVDWIDGTGGKSAAFDFTTKAILQEAAKTGEWSRLKDRHGKAPGLLGFWPSRAVTFIDNHDTGSTQVLSWAPLS